MCASSFFKVKHLQGILKLSNNPHEIWKVINLKVKRPTWKDNNFWAVAVIFLVSLELALFLFSRETLVLTKYSSKILILSKTKLNLDSPLLSTHMLLQIHFHINTIIISLHFICVCFFSSEKKRPRESKKLKLQPGELRLLSRLRLPTYKEYHSQIRGIPNLAFGSDHFPLVATFLLGVSQKWGRAENRELFMNF